MSNVYYSASGNPATGAAGTSATIRAEFNAIVAAFDKMPTPTGNAGKHLLVDPSGASLTVSSAITESAGVVTITGATVLDATANIAGSALVTLAASQTLTNKTLTAPVIATINNGGTLTLPTGPQTLVGRTTTDTLTNKTLTNPVINGFTGDTSTINIGSGQIVKDTAGNVGIGQNPTTFNRLSVLSSIGVTAAVSGKGSLGELFANSVVAGIRSNAYYDTGAASVKATTAGYSPEIQLRTDNGAIVFNRSTSVTADTNIVQSESLRIDASGNIGVNGTPHLWSIANGYRSVDIGSYASFFVDGPTGGASIASNVYANGNNTWIYRNSNGAVRYKQSPGDGTHRWYTAGVGTAGNAVTFSQVMILDGSGNLGVGVAAPAHKLHVVGGNAMIGGGAGYGLYLNSTSQYLTTDGVGTALVFGTGATERMRIDASGRLIVGGTSAAARIHSVVADGTQAFGVSGTTKGLRINTDANKVNVQGVDSTIGGSYQPIAIGGSTVTLQYNGTTDGLLLDAGGNIGISQTPSAWGTGFNAIQTKGGGIYSGDTDNIVVGQNFYDNGGASVRLTANPCSFYMQSGGTHIWGCAPTGTAGSTFTVWPEVMRISIDGVLRVSPTAGTSPGVAIAPTGAVTIGTNASPDGWGFSSFYRNGNLIGSVSQGSGGTSVAYNTTSDARLKTNIQGATESGGVIDQIRVVQYDWKSTGGHVDFGVIAQELHEVFPDAVTPGDDDRPWAWDASFLVPLLVKEIQALRSRVSALESA